MKRKKLLSACVAMALSGQTWAADVSSVDTSDETKKSSRITCPSDLHKLSVEQLQQLPSECRQDDNREGTYWLAGGLTVAGVTAAILAYNHNDDSHHHHNDTPPTPPVPPDDGGDVTPTPPDDDGDVTPPDDGGDVTPTPPDDGGDVTPPDDGGDVTPTPPDDGGDVTPPDDGGDVTPTPPDDDGDVTPPDDGGDVTPTPPDDGGDTPTPPSYKHVEFSNDVTWDEQSATLKIRDATFTYTKNDDGTWTLTAPNGLATILNGDWIIDEANNTIMLSGSSINSNTTWMYGDNGMLYIMKDDGITVDDPSKTMKINMDNMLIVDNGGNTALNGATVMDLTGNDITIMNEGDSTANGDGSIIAKITGNNISITNDGNIFADGGTAALITGDYASLTNEGDSTISNGGAGTRIDGDGARIANNGAMTVDGEDSRGVQITGDDAAVNMTSQVTVTNGAVGVEITGDNAQVINKNNITADGAGSTGVQINGDNASVTQDGTLKITDGAHGIDVTGNNTSVDNIGEITADGANSVGMSIQGDDALVAQEGDLFVSGAAHGIEVTGDRAKIGNTGNITVVDKDSIGILVNSDDATFVNTGAINASQNGTGVSLNGDREQVTLKGDITVTQEQDDSGIFQGATGVSVAGNDGNLALDGNINLVSDMGDNPTAGNSSLVGLAVSGSNNTLNLDGSVNITAYSAFNGDSYSGLEGISVSGSGNTVNLSGGIAISGDTGGHYIEGVAVSGKNTVNVSGHSVVDTTSVSGAVSVASVSGGGTLIFTDDSTLDIAFTARDTNYYFMNAEINATDAGSRAENQGTINAGMGSDLMMAISGASVTNTGTINATPLLSQDLTMSAVLRGSGTGSTATNKSGGTINLTSPNTPYYAGAGRDRYPNMWDGQTYYAVLADDYGTATNEAGATINLHGAGVYGVSASKGTANNAGTINVDGFMPTLDDKGNIIDSAFWQTGSVFLMGGGMEAGSTEGGRGDATALNTGTINVNNEGFGMLAMNGGTAINQGVINLTADSTTTKSQDNQLFGMGAINHGVAINDQTGVININTDIGQAFYNDGTGYIINNGSINLFGAPMADSDPHMGATPTDMAYLDALTGSGETDTRTSAAGFFTVEALANYGTDTLTGDVVTNAWLYNMDGGSLTINGDLTLNSGLENSGEMSADTITANTSIYNRAGGDMATDLLTINGNSTFYNEGNFTGSIAGTSYQQEIVNTGTMTVAEDGKSLVSGSFAFYNQEGATLTNTANAVEGGENAIINVTRTSDSVSQVNSGTIIAKNGYSAIKTANASNNPQWIWNTETGLITGETPDSALIALGRGYSFANEGTVTVQGDNAVAIQGGTTSYTVNLVNDGLINVGTEQGKTDGTNGEGLIGIQGNGKATTINNTENGVINVYANNSWAFGGQTKTIVNNGEVNLLCDTGCGIYAPGTTGTQEDHTGAADIAIPDANTAPAQGTVPTPPADSNAPQQLSNYIVGTNADGSAGKLTANNVAIGDNVKVDTGFSSGTADTTVVMQDVFVGSNITGAENITSTSVVWNAQGSQDASGNVDVTMTKNAYADVATDSSVSDVAQALDAGYTNNELYTSLNVGTTAELNSALKQISGSQATTVFREARVLSNRFSMLADAAPQVGNGLAFNVVAKGDPRAELGNDTQYDMLALRKTLDLTASQSLSLEYGIARLDGNGSDTAGDNGLTGGYSQFFGLKHQMSFDNGMSWNNALRYDVHNLDSSRSVAYSDVNKTADASVKQQYLEFRSEGAKTFELGETVKVTPYAGVKLRHTLEDGYQERNAGDFNLNMNSGSETAVDSIVGLKLDYAGKNGWSANATLEGGPNLSYAKSQRSATISGAGDQRFNVDDGQKGGGVNSLMTVGVKYSSKESALHLDAYQWKEDGISDKGFMLNFKKRF
ncbi:autotransporter domain-containing protein [Salmonella enterica]|nr:autotransporter domain-containing protein [Salmonella enterica]EDN8427218.1 autotransporter domain-containing protein [Salmonella enterica subsp. enterica]EDW2097072.1 autotransporter domain-containing protein [Salmonella enterica subsp. enterica]EEC0905239.1 autotransporter domain-containing protein [Salmonella enterica subsp. enterica]EEJ8540318.1 autotransporter domain-containing protein [Salmonella enterica subsp. enterica]